jgi:Flp pilus assembly pilin Flp
MTYRRPTFQSPEGQTLAEYALILSLLVAVVIVVLPLLGTSVLHLYTDFNSAFGG